MSDLTLFLVLARDSVMCAYNSGPSLISFGCGVRVFSQCIKAKLQLL